MYTHPSKPSRLVTALGLCAALSFGGNTALAHDTNSAHQHAVSLSLAAGAAAQAAADHTQALMALSKQWQNAQGASKSQALTRLIAKTEERADFLAELIQTDPAAVLRVAIPEEKQIGMPSEVLEMLEQRLELDGEVEAFIEDYADGSHKLRQFLNTPFGERFELLSAEGQPAFNSGDSVIVSGLALEDDEQQLTYLAYGGEETTMTEPAAPTLTTGDQRTLVMMINFQDDASQPFTEAQVYDTIFNQAAAYFEESSFNKMALSGDVYGWYTLPLSVNECDTNAIRIEAQARATAEGADLDSYQRSIYVFPANAACGWSGLATLGGLPSEAYLNGTLDLQVITHEIGHTLGLDHAMALECGAVSLGDDCSLGGSDHVDSMGGNLAHFNSIRKEWLGWFNVGDLLTVNSSGIYQIEPYATASGGLPKALKIDRGIDPISGEPQWFTVEYRQAVGFDSGIPDDGVDSDNILNGTMIRLAQDGYVLRSWVLDMTPESTWLDFKDPALTDGQSFTDPATGITITTLSTNGAYAEVAVEIPDTVPSCTTNAPSVELAAVSGNSAAPGSSLQYTATVTNLDSNDCDTAAFNLTASLPSSWSSSLSTNALTLAPGTSGTAALTVTSAGSAIDGSYIVQTTASHSVTGQSTNDSATYTVIAPPAPPTNSAPVAVNDSALIASKVAVIIAVLGNDSDPEGDALQVVAVTQGSKGVVVINGDGTLTYTPGKRFKNGDSFGYTLSDGELTASATVSVQLQSSGDGSSGGGGGGGGNGGGKGGGKK